MLPLCDAFCYVLSTFTLKKPFNPNSKKQFWESFMQNYIEECKNENPGCFPQADEVPIPMNN